MPDFRVADTAPEHPKLRAAGLAAIGLWAAAGAYAMRELTDGWVPDYWVQTWPAGRRAAGTLVGVGLWKKSVRNGIPGFAFHDFLDYQRPAAKIHEERAEARERARRNREAKKASAKRSGERSPEASGEVTADVRDLSHDSLSLTQKNSTHLDHSGAGSERADDRRATPHARPIPDDWHPHPGHRRLAEHRRVDLDHEAAQYRAHAVANGRRLTDWDAGFDLWLGNARPPATSNGAHPDGRRVSSTDRAVAEAQALKAELTLASQPVELRALPGGTGC